MKFYINRDAIILRASGKDSRRYLNARLSNDVKALLTGQHLIAAALSPQGKAEGLFSVLCLANDDFLVVCDGGNAEEVIAAFLRYKVADRVEIKDISGEYRHLIVFTENLPRSTTTSFFLNRKRAVTESFDAIIPQASLSDFLKDIGASEELDKNEYRLMNIKAGIPSFPDEINSEIIFSAAGLSDAISFKKGCYVGQEVVEKIDAYGRVPYIIRAAEVSGKLESIQTATVDGKPLDEDKILPRYYDKTENKTYFFLELKNADNILDSNISINDNEVRLLC